MGLSGSTQTLKLNTGLQKELPKKIAVAWSGGADSTALLHLLIAQGYDVMAWHVDHGWYGDSSQQAEILHAKAVALGIPFHLKKLEKPEKNLEAEARLGRYAAFEQLAEETSCFDVALAHHADDQAETVFMRMLQGSGVAGCQGMRAQRKQGTLNIWRPLLQASRKDIEAYLEENNVGWLEDPSNHNCELWRNKIRLQIFPAMGVKGVDPKQLFLRWQRQATRLQEKIEAMAVDIDIFKVTTDEAPYCEIEWALWLNQDKAIRLFLLQKMVKKLFDDQKVFGRRHILAIEEWKEHGGNGWLNLSGCCLYRQGKGLQLCQGNTSLRSSAAQKR